MSESFNYLAEQMFVGPLWPASILVCLLILYTAMAMFGLIDFGIDAPEIDALEIDIDASLDLDPGLDIDTVLEPTMDVSTDVDVPDAVPTDWDFWQGIGAASIRATNFGRVPVIIWSGVFAFCFWTISYLLWHGFDSNRYAPSLLPSVLLSIRNLVIATAATKALTQPLIKYFIAGPSYEGRGLVGATCEVSTLEATPEFGQAKYRTQAAPLLLNIRTDGPHIKKGTEVRIVDFDAQKRIYHVTHLPSDTQS